MRTEEAEWVGSQLSGGRYSITTKLGEGGMGAVYLARDANLDTDVVIKVPRQSGLDSSEAVQRFIREIRSLVQLAHPHVVKISDVGEHNGLPYAVMQYLPGGTLEDRRARTPDGRAVPFQPQQLCGWLREIATALDFIHAQGYVHRDVKPANILFDQHGNPYLADFGIVKALMQEEERRRSTAMTATGMVLGTPEYMAPEVIMGLPYDGRADQYALALIVYELLSGFYPFEAATPSAILVRQTTEIAPDLDTFCAGVPRQLAAAVSQAMGKEFGGRFADCTSFARTVLQAVSLAGDVSANSPTLAPGPPQASRDTVPQAGSPWYQATRPAFPPAPAQPATPVAQGTHPSRFRRIAAAIAAIPPFLWRSIVAALTASWKAISFPFRIIFRCCVAAIRGVDFALEKLAFGSENRILHNFLRAFVVAILAASSFVIYWVVLCRVPDGDQHASSAPPTVRSPITRVEPRSARERLPTSVVETKSRSLRQDTPRLMQIADQSARIGQRWHYRVTIAPAGFPQSEAVVRLESDGPRGMRIDPETHELSWTPNTDQVGQQKVEVVVENKYRTSLNSKTSFVITVRPSPPALVKYEAQTIDEGAGWTIGPVVESSGNTALPQLQLVDGPPGAKLDSSTGTLQWTPPKGSGGRTYDVVIRAWDHRIDRLDPQFSELCAETRFTLGVNRPPTQESKNSEDSLPTNTPERRNANLSGIWVAADNLRFTFDHREDGILVGLEEPGGVLRSARIKLTLQDDGVTMKGTGRAYRRDIRNADAEDWSMSFALPSSDQPDQIRIQITAPWNHPKTWTEVWSKGRASKVTVIE